MTATKILFAHNVAKIGGAEKVTLDIISGLDEDKFICSLLAPESGQLIESAHKRGANAIVFDIVQPSKKNFLKSTLFNMKIRQYLTKSQVSIIHTGDIFVARALIPAVKAMNIQLVCHMHFPPDDGALKWVFKAAPENIIFIYCSQELHDNVKQRLTKLTPGAKHVVVHNGVDIDLFKKTDKPKHLLPAAKLNIGIVANLQERKGHKEFIESAAELLNQHDNLAFHIIGGDVFGEKRLPLLQAKVNELKLTEHINFHGQVSNVRDYLNELDIYVCSSYEEAFPISILEAMAYSLPIASTDVNGIPEAINNEEQGLLFRPQNTEKLTAAILHLINNPEFRLRLGVAARERVTNEFSKKKFLNNISNAYSQSS